LLFFFLPEEVENSNENQSDDNGGSWEKG
jgi:hypothetical protein